MFGDVLAEDEVAAHVEVHHLVPGFHGVVLGRSAPGCACVVDQNVHMAQAFQRFVGQAADIGLIGTVGGDPAGIDASGLQVGSRLFQVRRLA
ncbi:hypothetical protein D3C72_2002650 [compost metagenome]